MSDSLIEIPQEQVAFDINDFPGGARAAIEAVLMVVDEPVSEMSLATALELPVEDVLARVGRATSARRSLARSDAPKTDDDGSLLSIKLRRLSERDRILLERLVDAMLEHEDR